MKLHSCTLPSFLRWVGSPALHLSLEFHPFTGRGVGWVGGWMRGTALSREVKEGFSLEMIFVQKSELTEAVRHGEI